MRDTAGTVVMRSKGATCDGVERLVWKVQEVDQGSPVYSLVSASDVGFRPACFPYEEGDSGLDRACARRKEPARADSQIGHRG